MKNPVVRLATRLFAPEVGAAAFRLRVLAEAFEEAGCRVEVITTKPPVGPIDDGRLRVSRWPVLRDRNGNVRGYVHYMSFDVPLLPRLLLRRRPQLLISEPPPTTGAVVRLVSLLQRKPYVYYAADIWSDGAASVGTPGVLVRVLRKMESWVLRKAALVLTVSDGVSERVLAMGVPAERICLVGNGIDTDMFSPEGDRQDIGAPYFAYTGTMSEWQGADVFVRAVAQVRQTHPEVQLVFLGQGSELPALRELAEKSVPGAVRFEGVVPPAQAARWLRGATAAMVSIKPGLGYDFAKPTKIYAATGCGVPVLFAGAGAGAELVAEQRLGLAPGFDVDAVAGAMRQLLDGEADIASSAELAQWTADNASLRASARQAARASLIAAGVAN